VKEKFSVGMYVLALMQTKFVVKARRELKSFLWRQTGPQWFIWCSESQRNFPSVFCFSGIALTTATLGPVLLIGAVHQQLQSKKGEKTINCVKSCIKYTKNLY